MSDQKLTLLQRLNNVIKAITVEPIAFFMLTGTVLGSAGSQTLALDKVCRVNLNLSEAICDAVRSQDTDDNAENEKLVQEYLVPLMAYKSIITSILPFMFLMFAGGWMDLTGRRKVMMILPLVGANFVQVANILNVVFFFQLRVEYLVFIDAILTSICGGWALLFMAIFSYITDMTTEQNRTYRLGLVSFAVYIAMPFGNALSGYLLKIFGYMTVYITALVLALINLTYTIFVLSDPERTKEHKSHDRGFLHFLKAFFTPVHFVNSLKVVFKKTPKNRSVLLCVLLGATVCLFGPYYGEQSIMYMSARYRFGWDELQYSMFQTYNTVLNITGIMFSILVLSKKLGWHDSVLVIISTSSKILASFVFCFAPTGGVFLLGPFIDILNGSCFIAIRSIFSKTVESHEIAKMTSIVSITEVLTPLMYVPLYTTVYAKTMEVLPGAVFLMGAAFVVPPLIVFLWLLYTHLKQRKSKSSSIE